MTHLEQIGLQPASGRPGKLGARWSRCLLLSVSALLCSCSPGLGRVDGRVVDAGRQNEPLANAIVAAVRMRAVASMAGPPAVCADLKVTHSDAQGRFHFDPWQPPPKPLWHSILPDQYWVKLTVYKRGFSAGDKGPTLTVNASYDGIIRLQKTDELFEHQLQIMHNVTAGIGCEASNFNLSKRPLLEAMEIDAVALAVTPQQMDAVEREFGSSDIADIRKLPKSLALPPKSTAPNATPSDAATPLNVLREAT